MAIYEIVPFGGVSISISISKQKSYKYLPSKATCKKPPRVKDQISISKLFLILSKVCLVWSDLT